MTPRASFLVVRVRPKGWRWPLMVPVPLFVVEEALEASAWLVRVLSWTGWRGARRWTGTLPETLLQHGLELPAALVRQLRDSGRFTLAEIKDETAYVSVRLV